MPVTGVIIHIMQSVMGGFMRKFLVVALLIALSATIEAAEKKKGAKKDTTTTPEPALVAPQPAPAAQTAPAEQPAAPAPDAAQPPTPETPAEAPAPAEEEKKEEKAEQTASEPAPSPIPPAEPLVKEEWVDPAPYGSAGLGLGMFYGFFGVNIDVHPIQKRWWNGITLTASAGETNIGKFAFAGGIRYFILPRDFGWRPRITVMYGINAVTDYNIAIITDTGAINFREKKTFHGLNIGIGLQYMFGEDRRHGFDFDMVVIAYSTVNDHIDKLRKDPNISPYVSKDDKPFPLVLSFGYRLAF